MTKKRLLEQHLKTIARRVADPGHIVAFRGAGMIPSSSGRSRFVAAGASLTPPIRHSRESGNPRVVEDTGSCEVALLFTGTRYQQSFR
jgi:hypothetical protein